MGESAVTDEVAIDAITWFARLRADDVTARDRQRFFDWLRLGPEQGQAFVEVLQLWDDMAATRGLEIDDVAAFQPLTKVRPRVGLQRD
ncbi:MAG: FecR/PupR family sigma factor regulator [Gammaproteobacteria bacterium]|nr:FecR/PupR family sigma factor regulator [Gammaproteobacteria bacterium]